MEPKPPEFCPLCGFALWEHFGIVDESCHECGEECGDEFISAEGETLCETHAQEDADRMTAEYANPAGAPPAQPKRNQV